MCVGALPAWMDVYRVCQVLLEAIESIRCQELEL